MKNELYLCGLFFKSKHYYFGLLTNIGLTVVSVLNLYFVCARFDITDYNIKIIPFSNSTVLNSNKTYHADETVDCHPSQFEVINIGNESKASSFILVAVNLILYFLTCVSCIICAYSNPGILSDYHKDIRVSVS